ncbi:MAG: hypothetical protein WCG26_16275, partial [Chloroflexales bacterium]
MYWVKRWLSQNGLPESMIAPEPGRVWVGSPTFAAAKEQIRPKLMRWAPSGTKWVGWDQTAEAEARIPGGGVMVSKAYKQFDQDNQSWEGANVRAACVCCACRLVLPCCCACQRVNAVSSVHNAHHPAAHIVTTRLLTSSPPGCYHYWTLCAHAPDHKEPGDVLTRSRVHDRRHCAQPQVPQ